jgi:hypothetical protein
VLFCAQGKLDGATGWLSASAFKEMHVPGSLRGRGNVSPGGTLLLFVVLVHLQPLLLQERLRVPLLPAVVQQI